MAEAGWRRLAAPGGDVANGTEGGRRLKVWFRMKTGLVGWAKPVRSQTVVGRQTPLLATIPLLDERLIDEIADK
jgi:hypothetical protein